MIKHDSFVQLICPFLSIVGLLAVLIIILFHPLRIGFDQAQYMLIADLIRQGKVLYVDMFDNNPPAICYISLIPSTAASLFNVPAPQSFMLFIWSLCVYCTAMIYYLFRKHPPACNAMIVETFIASIPLFNFLWTTKLMRSLFEFGQREHIFMLTFLPYFYLRWLVWDGIRVNKPIAIVIGILAGIGLCVKPFFLIPPVIIELFFMVERKKKLPPLTAEILAAVALLLVYAIHFLFLPNQAKHVYFDLTLPILVLGYDYFTRSTLYLFNYHFSYSHHVFYASIASIGLAAVLLRLNYFLAPLTVLMLSTYFIYIMQGKGWPYHLLPVTLSTFLLQNCLLVLLFQTTRNEIMQQAKLGRLNLLQTSTIEKRLDAWLFKLFLLSIKPVTRILGYSGTAGLAFALCLTAWYCMECHREYMVVTSEPQFDLSNLGYRGTTSKLDLTRLTKKILELSNQGDAISVICDSTEPGATALLQTRRRPGSRHLDIAMLGPMHFVKTVYPAAWKTKFSECIDSFIDEVTEDINKNPPKLIFLQHGHTTEWFNKRQFTREISAHYDDLGKEDIFTLYRLKQQ